MNARQKKDFLLSAAFWAVMLFLIYFGLKFTIQLFCIKDFFDDYVTISTCHVFFASDFHNFLPSCRCFLFYRISIEYIIALFIKNGKVNINGTFNKISLLVTFHFILQYFQICSEGCPEAAKWSDLTQDVADMEQSDSLVQERNRGCADQYEEYEDLAYQ